MLKRIFFVLIVLFAFSVKGQSIRFFVSAHQDDWQLFMNPNVANSIKNTTDKTVILHTTAGDAGEGLGKNEYYKAREEGSLRALRFLVHASQDTEGKVKMRSSQMQINQHAVLRYEFQNTVVYFLRLPDGNGTGVGYPLHNHESLERLYNQEVSTISTIDDTTTYRSLQDLKNTLHELIQLEKKGYANTEIHLADTDTTINPDDHSDHQTSSKIIQEVGSHFKSIVFYHYQNYVTSKKENNVSEEDYLISAATWGVTASGISDKEHYSTWDSVHNAWIGKQYFRTSSSKK